MCPFKLLFLYFGGKYSVVQFLDSKIVLFLIFWAISMQFSSGGTSLHSYQQCKGFFPPPHPCQHLFVFLILAILKGVRWYFIVILICISLSMRCWANFRVLLAICMSSLEKCLFMSSAHFIFFFWNFLNCFYLRISLPIRNEVDISVPRYCFYINNLNEIQ